MKTYTHNHARSGIGTQEFLVLAQLYCTRFIKATDKVPACKEISKYIAVLILFVLNAHSSHVRTTARAEYISRDIAERKLQ